MRLVQIKNNQGRRVALVDGSRLRLLAGEEGASVYALVLHAMHKAASLSSLVQSAVTEETLDYDAVYNGSAPWRLLPSFDTPEAPEKCMVSGTGLTHKKSAENRAAMHKQEGAAEITDSFRMYQMGLEGGDPGPGRTGVQPEWFYKGDGSILRGDGDTLFIPPYAWDGGEEPEIAGVYVISPGGEPFRIGFTVGNEFSDHRMEKKNYLYLAHSKLRNCAIGPELSIGEFPFEDVPGSVGISRAGASLWRKEIWTGQKNMSYSVSNLEHHHFKYATHKRPGDAHVHFFGADAFSFGDGIALLPGDVMEVSFPQFGRPLRNTLSVQSGPESVTIVRPL